MSLNYKTFIKIISSFLEKKKAKKRALPSHPKIGDLNFLNAEEKTPSKNQRFSRCRLADFRFAHTT